MLEGATGSENREVPTFREARQRHDTNVTPWLEQACEADDCRLASSEGSGGSLGRLRPTEGPWMREWEGDPGRSCDAEVGGGSRGRPRTRRWRGDPVRGGQAGPQGTPSTTLGHSALSTRLQSLEDCKPGGGQGLI